jgi:hypothetical protein
MSIESINANVRYMIKFVLWINLECRLRSAAFDVVVDSGLPEPVPQIPRPLDQSSGGSLIGVRHNCTLSVGQRDVLAIIV